MSGSAPCPPPAARTSVLVLEDDEGIRESLVELLGDEGYEVRAASTLDEGRAHLEGAIRAVLLDLRLDNGENGATLLLELAARDDAPAVVLVSASVEQVVPLVRAFGVPSVPKPFDIDELLATLRAAIDAAARPRRT